MRKFEKVRDDAIKYEATDVILPRRATKNSAGYDFFSPIDFVLNPGEIDIIWTNVKACFNTNEVLLLFPRSSQGKFGVCIANGTGVIECDYYGNVDNDGNLAFRLINHGNKPYVIKKGDKIGQGVFTNFLLVDNEVEVTTIRKGGFGSTGE